MAYSTQVEAAVYFLNRLHVASWTAASLSDREKALEEATQRMDRLRYSGIKVDVDQDNEFPRYYGDEADGTEEVPADIKTACNECAFALLDEVYPEKDFENLSVVSEAFASVRTSYDRESVSEHVAAGIPSAYAWRFLKPFLADAQAIRLNRVS